ncbi:MAG TPA: DUF1287 domain-containing protein [Candidatus Polarisedimenticolia bacterium]|nr:DUF1287 domain-containing protein [Candidatus Polarisedimenticolia bacterium]
MKSDSDTKRLILHRAGIGCILSDILHILLRLEAATIGQCSLAGESDGGLAPIVVCALFPPTAVPQTTRAPESSQEFLRRLVVAAVEGTHHSVRYVSAYVRIPYPGGDVPADTGVCADEIIRSYRAVGVDLQKEAHEDMLQNLSLYPNKSRWLLATQIRTSITGACRTSWFSSVAKERRCLAATARKTTRPETW